MSKRTRMAIERAREARTIILDEFRDRGGFDDWWRSIDTGIQVEINDRIDELIAAKIIEALTDE